MSIDPILIADRAEERAAADALRAATTRDDLVSAWWKHCEGFSGKAWDRLSAVYSEKLRAFGALQP